MGQLPHGVLPAGPACAAARTPAAPAPVADRAGSGRTRRRLHAPPRPRAARDDRAVAPATGRRRRPCHRADASLGVDGTPASVGGPRGTFRAAREPDADAVDVLATSSAGHHQNCATNRCTDDVERAAVAASVAVTQFAPTAAAPDLVPTSGQWRVVRDRRRFTRHFWPRMQPRTLGASLWRPEWPPA